MLSARPFVDQSRIAPTRFEFRDEFSGSSVADAERNPGGGSLAHEPDFWTEVAPADTAITEASGSLTITVGSDGTAGPQASAYVLSKKDYRFNFFKQPIRIKLSGISFTGTDTRTATHQFNLFLTPTAEQYFTGADAMRLRITKAKVVKFSVKEDSASTNPEAVSLLEDQTATAIPTTATLDLDETSYRLEVTDGTDTDVYQGLHGLSDWGDSYLGIECVAANDLPDGSSITNIGQVESTALLAFDVFQGSSVRATGYQSDFWTVDETDTDTAIAESDGLVLTADGTGSTRSAYVISDVDKRFNPFTQEMTISGNVAWSGSVTDANEYAEIAVCSEAKNPTDAKDAILLRMSAGGAWSIHIQEDDAGVHPSNVAAADSGTGLGTITKFTLTLNRTTWTVALAATTPDTGTGANGIDEQAWGTTTTYRNSCDSALVVGAFRNSASDAAVATITNFTVTHDNDIAYQDSVLGPVSDGIPLGISKMPTQQWKAIRFGVVDPTKAPFNADNTGATDATQALQHAIDFCLTHKYTLFIPSGTYLVSDTLKIVVPVWNRTADITTMYTPDENGAMMIMGSQVSRPVIKLAASSAGFNDTSASGLKPVIDVYARKVVTNDPWLTNPNILFSTVIRGVDIEVDSGNSGAIGVRCPGAQGASLQDMDIDLTTSGYMGISGGCGAGGGMHNVYVNGGTIGIDTGTGTVYNYRGSASLGGGEPCTVVSGSRFNGQSLYAARVQNLASTVFVGTQFTSCPTVAVYSPDSTGAWSSEYGFMSFEDCSFAWDAYAAGNIAIRTARSLYLNNCYTDKAGIFADFYAHASDLTGFNGIKEVGEFAQGIQPPNNTGETPNLQTECPVYQGNTRDGYTAYSSGVTTGGTIPSDLRTSHVADYTQAHIESNGLVNVKDYGATGDSITDDTAAIQAAIDDNPTAVIWVPKGYYRLTSPLTLQANTKLIGAGRTISVLIARDKDGGNSWSTDASPNPLIQTVDSASAAPFLADFCLHAPVGYPGVYCMNYRSGLGTVNIGGELRSDFGYASGSRKTAHAPENAATVTAWRFTGNAGGKVYNLYEGSHYATEIGSRHFYIANTDGNALRFYSLNGEHCKSNAVTEFAGASDVRVYGFKTEGNYCGAWFTGSSTNCAIIGGGGNGCPPLETVWDSVNWPGEDAVGIAGTPSDFNSGGGYAEFPAMFRIDSGCTSITLANTVEDYDPSRTSTLFGNGYDGNNNHWIWDESRTTPEINVKDRPVLYKSVN